MRFHFSILAFFWQLFNIEEQKSNLSESKFWLLFLALRQFGPKTNSDQKPDSDQRQIRTQFWNSAQIISLINLII